MAQPNRTKNAGYLWTGEGVTLAGTLINLALVLVKGAAGVLAHSSALVADAVHSLSDIATDIIVLLGFRLGQMPEDANHPYGHGKVETLGTALLGAILIAVGVAMGYQGAAAMGTPPESVPGALGLWAAAASIAAKESLYRWTVHVARATESRLLLANAWHHRSDAFSSVAALLGVFGARWGLPWMDPLAALIVSVFVAKVGWNLAWQATHELLDASVDGSLLEQINRIVHAVEGVRGSHSLRARRLGKDVLVDVDIEVDPELNVIQGHDVARAVREALIGKLRAVRDAMVHVEPVGARDGGLYAPDQRHRVQRAAAELARREPGVLGLHGLRAVPLGTGYLLNVDIEVEPELSVRTAHEIAHRFKERLRTLPGVADAVIHVDVHGD